MGTERARGRVAVVIFAFALVPVHARKSWHHPPDTNEEHMRYRANFASQLESAPGEQLVIRELIITKRGLFDSVQSLGGPLVERFDVIEEYVRVDVEEPSKRADADHPLPVCCETPACSVMAD